MSRAGRSSLPRTPETARLRVASFPTRTAHTPGAAQDRDRDRNRDREDGWLARGYVGRTRGSSSLWGQQGAEMPHEGGIRGSTLSWCESWGRGSVLEG